MFLSTAFLHRARPSRPADRPPPPPKSGRIAPRIPNEIFQRIIDILGENDEKPALSKVLQTSRAAYTVVAPTLYNKVTLTRANAESFYSGLAIAPRLPRRRPRERTITWQEFDTKTLRAVRDGGRNVRRVKKRKLELVWPGCKIDSDDDMDELLDHYLDEDKFENYPNDDSSARKVQLLGLVTHISVRELPPRQVCENLACLALVSSLPNMRSLKSLSFMPKASWHVMDWEDRHKDDTHPFVSYIKGLFVIDLCVQLPLADAHLEKSYMESRIVSWDQHQVRNDLHGVPDQKKYLERHLQHLFGRYSSVLGLALRLSSYKCENITIHNLTAGIPSTTSRKSCRVFYRPCACRDPSGRDKVKNDFCYNHHAAEKIKAEDLPKLSDLFLSDRFERFEAVDVDWISGSFEDGERSSAMVDLIMDGMQKRVGDEKEYVNKVVSFKTSDEAEPCVCCGQRQLSAEQGSIASA